MQAIIQVLVELASGFGIVDRTAGVLEQVHNTLEGSSGA
jgi:hypothetical protein